MQNVECCTENCVLQATVKSGSGRDLVDRETEENGTTGPLVLMRTSRGVNPRNPLGCAAKTPYVYHFFFFLIHMFISRLLTTSHNTQVLRRVAISPHGGTIEARPAGFFVTITSNGSNGLQSRRRKKSEERIRIKLVTGLI